MYVQATIIFVKVKKTQREMRNQFNFKRMFIAENQLLGKKYLQ